MSSLGRGKRFTLLISVLAAGACTSDRTPSATVEPHIGAAQAAVGTVSSCDVTQLQKDAKTYFGNQDPVYAFIKELNDACKRSNQTGANAAAFKILNRIAQVAGLKAALAATGENIASAVIAFTDVGTAPTEADLINALGTNGLFEVRGGVYGTAVALSRPGGPGWALEAAWTNQVLIYGWAIPSGYDINTWPAGAFAGAGGGTITNCYAIETDAAPPTERIQHGGVGSHEILNLAPSAVNCPDWFELTDVQVAAVEAPLLLAAAQRAWDFFAPREAWALAPTKVGGVGGFGSDLSPHYSPELGATVSSFVAQPRDDSVSTELNDTDGLPLRVRVVAQNDAGLVIPGAIVKIYVSNNSGETAGAYLTMPGDLCQNNVVGDADDLYVCAETDGTGVATFTGLMTNKAGGYLLAATATFDVPANQITGNTVISNLFNVQNK
jgi:hypothetical protein